MRPLTWDQLLHRDIQRDQAGVRVTPKSRRSALVRSALPWFSAYGRHVITEGEIYRIAGPG